MPALTTFSIGDVVARTGVAEGTLRMWESRHGFPAPQRLASGHRRYGERDVELVRRVAADRAAGVALGVAIERAVRSLDAPARSLFAALRRSHPELEPCTLTKRSMLALSRAMEAESLSRAERPLLFAAFQRECHYREDEPRWRELARGAAVTIAFADFARLRVPESGPTEVPIAPDDPLVREWAIVCDAPGHAVCLTGWEPPASAAPAGRRRFEAIWSFEPAVVREAARICAAIAGVHQPSLGEELRARLDDPPAQPAAEQLRLAAAITNRTLAMLDGAG